MRAPLLLLLVATLAAVDGDTVIVRIGDAEERVRLLWLDTPESKANKHGAAIALPAPGAEPPARTQRVQEVMIDAGWSPYWRKYGQAPEPLHARLLAVQEAAEAAKAGAWGTAEQWMRDKASERTAPSEKAKGSETEGRGK